MFKIKNVTIIRFRTVYLYISNLIYCCLFSPDQPPPVFFRHYQVTSRLFDMKREISSMFWCALQTLRPTNQHQGSEKTLIYPKVKPWGTPATFGFHLWKFHYNLWKKKVECINVMFTLLEEKTTQKQCGFHLNLDFFLFSVYVCV